MRLSIATKLFVSFALVLGLSLAPAYWYVHRHLTDRVFEAVERELAMHVERVANRLSRVPDAEIDAAARDLAEVLVDRVSVFALDGRVLGESSLPREQVAQMENHFYRQEVQQALHSGSGRALRTSTTKGEPYLYVARLFYDGHGRARGVVRLSRPLGAIASTFSSAFLFLNRSGGVAASLMVLLSLAISLFVARPLRGLTQAAQAYGRGDYAAPLPRRSSDEIGELGESMGALARRIQQEMVTHSTADALRAELVRAVPVPLLLLGPELELQEVNAPFRDAVGIDPANEHVRIHELCRTREFSDATVVAAGTGQPQALKLQPPWRRQPQSFTLWPLPAAGGRMNWALFCPEAASGAALEADRAQAQLRQRAPQLVEELRRVCPAPGALARLLELRAAVDALLPATMPVPESIAALDFPRLLLRLLDEVQPLAEERHVHVEVEGVPAAALIADCDGRAERALRGALVRALLPSRPGLAETILTVSVYLEPTVVQVQLSGMAHPLPAADLDRLLSPLGGSAGPVRDPAAAAVQTEPVAAVGAELWLQLRRA